MNRGQEIAWAAGLFEGEGCISTSSSLSHRLLLNLTSTDHDVVLRFLRVVGVGIVDERRRTEAQAHWKPQWSWRASGADAEDVARRLLPYLGQRRAARARELLAARDAHRNVTTAPRTCPGCGREFRPGYYAMSERQRYCTTDCYDKTDGKEVKRASHQRRRAQRKEAKV